MPHQLDPWFYPVNGIVPGIYPVPGKTDKTTDELINRARCRLSLLVDAVKARYDFNGKNVLDVACNCGFWSSQYGAQHVTGVEGRELFIQQAELVNPEGSFIQADVAKFNYKQLGNFEFILCAGILYHVLEPHALLEKLCTVNTEVMVVDTRVGGSDEVCSEPRNLCFNAIDGASQKRVPVKKNLIACLVNLGYEVEQLHPTFETMPGVDSGDNYNTGQRICLFCRKK